MAEQKWEPINESHAEDLEFFSQPAVNSGVLEYHMIEYKPLSQVVAGGPVEFSLTPATFVDLKKSRVRFKIRLENADGSTIPKETLSERKTDKDGKSLLNPDAECGPVCCPFYAMCSQVDFSLSQVNTTTSLTTNGFAYKNYIDLLTSKPCPTHKSVLFIPDNPKGPAGRSPYMYGNHGMYGYNSSLMERSRYLIGSRSLTMEGPVGVDMFEQNRLLIHNVPISLKYYPNHHAFYLMSPNDTKGFRAVVEDATLILCHVTVNDAVTLGVDNTLKAGKQAIYPINESIFKTYTISQNSTNATFDSVFNNDCPDSLMVALVDSNSFSGSYFLNPFNSAHFQCNHISFSYMGVSVPGRPLTPEFETTEYNSNFIEAYNRLYKNNKDMEITPNQFLNGSTMYFFDLNDTSNPDMIPLSKSGNTRLEIRFKESLKDVLHR